MCVYLPIKKEEVWLWGQEREKRLVKKEEEVKAEKAGEKKRKGMFRPEGRNGP